MVDFTMCSNQECLLGDYCDRQTAQRSKRQSFAYFAPNKGAESCDSMIPNEQYKSYLIMCGREHELNSPMTMKFLKSRYYSGKSNFSLQEISRIFRENKGAKIRFIDYESAPLFWNHTVSKGK